MADVSVSFDFPGVEDGERAVKMLSNMEGALKAAKGSGESLKQLRQLFEGLKGKSSVLEELRNAVQGLNTAAAGLSTGFTKDINQLKNALRSEFTLLKEVIKTQSVGIAAEGTKMGQALTASTVTAIKSGEAEVQKAGKSLAAQAKAAATKAYDEVQGSLLNAGEISKFKLKGATIVPDDTNFYKDYVARNRTFNKLDRQLAQEQLKTAADKNTAFEQAERASAKLRESQMDAAFKAHEATTKLQSVATEKSLKEQLNREIKIYEDQLPKVGDAARALDRARKSAGSDIVKSRTYENQVTNALQAMENGSKAKLQKLVNDMDAVRALVEKGGAYEVQAVNRYGSAKVAAIKRNEDLAYSARLEAEAKNAALAKASEAARIAEIKSEAARVKEQEKIAQASIRGKFVGPYKRLPSNYFGETVVPKSPHLDPKPVEDHAKALKRWSFDANDAHSAARGLASGFNLLWLTWGNMLPLLTGAALSFGFTKALKSGAEFQQSLFVIGELAGNSASNVNKISTSLLELGKTSQYGPLEAAKAVEQLTLAGLSATEAMQALKPTLRFAAAGGVDAKAAADTLVAVATAYGFSAGAFDTVADVIASTAATSMASVSDMSEAFKTASVLAQQYKVSLDDTSEGLALLANIGIKGTAAGTSLRNMYSELGKASGKSAEAVKDLNIAVFDNKGAMLPMLTIMESMSKGLINMTGASQQAYLAKLANERGAKTLSAAQAEALKKVKELATEELAAAAAADAAGNKQEAHRQRILAVGKAYEQMRQDMKDAADRAASLTFMADAEAQLRPLQQYKGLVASLESSLVTAFNAASDSVFILGGQLRTALNSTEFQSAVTAIVTGVTGFIGTLVEGAKFLYEHRDATMAVVAAYIAFNTYSAISAGALTTLMPMIAGATAALWNLVRATEGYALVSGLVAASTSVFGAAANTAAGAFTGLAASTGLAGAAATSATVLVAATGVALGVLAVALVGGAAAWAIFGDSARAEAEKVRQAEIKVRTERAKSLAEQTKQVDDSVTSEIARLRTVIAARKDGLTEEQANQKAYGEAHLTRINQRYDDMIAIERLIDSERRLRMARSGVDEMGNVVQGADVAGAWSGMTDETIANIERLNKARDADLLSAKGQLSELQKLYKEKAELDKRAAASKVSPITGTTVKTPRADDTAGPASKVSELKASIEATKQDIESLKKLGSEYTKVTEAEKLAMRLKEELRGDLKPEARANKLKELDLANELGELQKKLNLEKKHQEKVKKSKDEYDKMVAAIAKSADSINEQAEALEEANKVFGKGTTAVQQLKLAHMELQMTEAQGSDRFTPEYLTALEQKIQAQKRYVEALQGADYKTLNAGLDEWLRSGLASAGVYEQEAQMSSLNNAERAKQIANRKIELELQKELANIANSNLPPEQKKKLSTRATSGAESLKDATSLQIDVSEFDKLIGTIDKVSLDGLFNGAIDGALKFATALNTVAEVSTRMTAALKANAKINKDDPAKKASEEARIMQQGQQAQITGYAAMVSGLKSYAKEGSRTYAALQNAERVFHAFQLAMSIKTMVQKSGLLAAYTTAKVAADGTMAASAVTASATSAGAAMVEGQAKAVSGVAGQASGDPYTAFPRMAAMAAIMAGLGFIVGGIGGKVPKAGPTNSGTGTVLGDPEAKSDSLARALDLLNTTELTALKYSRAMATSLGRIEANIGGFAQLLVRSTGGAELAATVATGYSDSGFSKLIKNPLITGVYGILANIPGISSLATKLFGAKTSIVGQGIGGDAQSFGKIMSEGFTGYNYVDVNTEKKALGLTYSNRTSESRSGLDSQLEAQIGLVFTGIGDAVMQATQALGADMAKTSNTLNNYVVNLGRIDLRGLTGTQVSEKLTNVFGAEADRIAQAVLPGLEDLQKVGEGYYQTLVRAASLLETVNLWQDRLSSSLVGVGVAGAQAADELVTSLGGLEKYQSAMDDYYQTYYTEAERSAKTMENIGKAFADLNLAVPTSTAAYRALVESQDLNTKSGRELFKTLIDLAPTFAEATKGLAEAGQTLLDEINRLRGEITKDSPTNLATLQSQFATTTAAARAGDKTALEKLPGLSQALEEAGKNTATTALDVARLRGWLAQSLSDTMKALGLEVPAFAAGGDHLGGWRLVGENGPELQATGPSRIYNARQTQSILRNASQPSSRDEAVAERMDALIAEVQSLRAEARATAVANVKMAKILTNVSQNGDSLSVTTNDGDTVTTKAAA